MRLAAAVLAALLVACTTLPPDDEAGGPALAGTAQRPQLDAATAARFAAERVLGLGGRGRAPVHDGWNPAADSTLRAAAPPRVHYHVGTAAAADGVRRFATVQAAVNRAHADTLAGRHHGETRLYITIDAGRYVETVYVPPTPLPLTLWGSGTNPRDVHIEFALDAGIGRDEYRRRVGAVYETAGLHDDIAAIYRQCARPEATGTSCSAVVSVANDGFQARNLTVANRYDPAEDRRRSGRSHQAVAFKSEGADRVHLERVHLRGYQDTLYLRSRGGDHIARSFVRGSLVEGDVDFIFGAGTAFFLDSEIRWVGHRRGQSGGWVGAPSTSLHVPYGFVFERCRFTADDPTAASGRTVHLARQWFVGARCSPYGERGAACRIDPTNTRSNTTTLPLAALEAVGKMVVLRSELGAHLRADAPWAPWQPDRRAPNHRPAQFDRDDFMRRLMAAGVDTALIGAGGDAADHLPFLAEHRNHGPASKLAAPSR